MNEYILLIGIMLYIIGLSKTINLGKCMTIWQQTGIILIMIGIFFIGYWVGFNKIQ